MTPTIEDRIRRHNIDNAERKQKNDEHIRNAVNHLKQSKEMAQWKSEMKFNMYLLALQIVLRLETIIIENEPTTDEWNEDFCKAVELLPEARRFADDCMMNCMEVREC